MSPEMLSELELAYAITAHKSQGSEYRAVTFAIGGGAPMLLTRGVLYTAITRAPGAAPPRRQRGAHRPDDAEQPPQQALQRPALPAAGRSMRALFSQLLDLLYPPKCVFCRRLLRPEEHDVCARCAHELEPIPAPLRRGQFYTECYAVYPYEGVVAESLRRFKFSGQSQYAASFGRMLAPLLRTAPFEILSWVPVSAKRRRSRGYDQTELLAHAVAKELELPCTQTLQKIRHNPAQSSQRDAAARRANVLGAYRAVSPERFAGRSVLLIDDILTTGATLSECSRVLLTAGASSVVCSRSGRHAGAGAETRRQVGANYVILFQRPWDRSRHVQRADLCGRARHRAARAVRHRPR